MDQILFLPIKKRHSCKFVIEFIRLIYLKCRRILIVSPLIRRQNVVTWRGMTLCNVYFYSSVFDVSVPDYQQQLNKIQKQYNAVLHSCKPKQDRLPYNLTWYWLLLVISTWRYITYLNATLKDLINWNITLSNNVPP